MDNRKILLWASFLTLIAAGMGFGIRTGVLKDWETAFGFTKQDLGKITGGGLTGFGVTIIFFSPFVDRIGYKPLLVLAFLLHVASAVVTLAATPVYASYGRDATYWCLYVGMFMFALANGVCETVINPLVATLFPTQKTHYLNILHAGWPGGLILGSTLAYFFVSADAAWTHLRWEIPMIFFLVPTVMYGWVVLKEKFPISEARAAGVDFATMLREFVAPMFLFLLVLHAMVGYVELGTDSWITNIMNNVIPGRAVLLFIYTSSIMFVLRFFAGPIVEKINPIGLLLISAILGCIGLYYLSVAEMGLAILLAGTIYGLGKTFFWPTMLGVVGERFPKGGAITMGTIGGVGMLSAGLLGTPGIGYKQDYYATKKLQAEAPQVYERYKADELNSFLFLPEITGLDGTKVGKLQDRVDVVRAKEAAGDPITAEEQLTPQEESDKGPVLDARIYGGRMALRWTALVPAMMAVGYLILAIYFRAKGGYKVEVLHGAQPIGEHYTGGVEGPVE
jgi:MFS family permease